MLLPRLIIVGQDYNIGTDEILRILVTPILRTTGGAGCGHSQVNKCFDRLLAFSNEDNPLGGYGLHDFSEAIKDATCLPQGPNPAVFAVRTTLAKAFGGVAHDLEQSSPASSV